MYYVRARWYDLFGGRFLSEDPIGLAGGINLFAYAGNDPVNFTDPTGLQRECIVRGYHHLRRVGEGPWEYTSTEITYFYCTQDEDVPHHWAVATPELARKQMYGPWALRDDEQGRLQCLSQNWLTTSAGGHLSSLLDARQVFRADLAGLYGDDYKTTVAVTVSPTMVLFSEAPLRYHNEYSLAYNAAHEVRHTLMMALYGPDLHSALYDNGWSDYFENDARAYSHANVQHRSINAPSCSPLGKP